MDELFSECLAFTLRTEGGYVDNPDDPGGATNMGITLATYRTWSDDPSAGISQIRDLTTRIAGAIYRMLYWNPLRGDALPAGVDLSVFDFGVNAGVWRSGRVLQLALGFSGDTVDGCVGPETLAAADKTDAQELIEALASRQAMYYRSLKDYSFFGQGWLNRTEARRDAALAMLDNSPTRKV
jgi:lysozyme family protein